MFRSQALAVDRSLIAAELDCVSVNHSSDAGIDILGKNARIADPVAERIKINTVNIIHKHDAMRITDSNTTDIDRFAAYINRLVDYHVCVGLHRNACRIKIGLADIDLSRSYLAVERIQTNVLYAAVGFNFHCRFRHNSVIIEELCSTANTVRSHKRLSSVVVINNHFASAISDFSTRTTPSPPIP